MCGIVGAVSAREDIVPTLIQGLQRLEYRGYDSAGIATWDEKRQSIQCTKQSGKVDALRKAVKKAKTNSTMGIAHTRWATHGKPNQTNAHPHASEDKVALVHNGIIENADAIKAELKRKGYRFISDTDTEVIVHLIHEHYRQCEDFATAILKAENDIEGSYALLIMHEDEPDALYAISHKSPLLVGKKQNGDAYFASDAMALSGVVDKGFYLQSDQLVKATPDAITLSNAKGKALKVKFEKLNAAETDIDKGPYKHFMHKEIHEQPQVIRQILSHYYKNVGKPIGQLKELKKLKVKKIKRVHIVGCGTSYYSGLMAKYWFEELLNLPVTVTLGSEFHYRHMVVEKDTLLIALSQSGETADTLESIRSPQSRGYTQRLAMCNVPQSSMVRDCDLFMPLLAGPEIGVASTKAFTAQLMVLLTLCLNIAYTQKKQSKKTLLALQKELFHLPLISEAILEMEPNIKKLAKALLDSDKVLFLGRHLGLPTALEGALKLKEISYIHAHAYPAGELKHGPLALIDERLYLVALLPEDHLIDKTISNLQEVQARGGRLILFHQGQKDLKKIFPGASLQAIPKTHPLLSPFPFTLALQLLAYHVAQIKGLDVDKPRNLAKSVTVE